MHVTGFALSISTPNGVYAQDGETSLALAFEGRHPEVVEKLLAHTSSAPGTLDEPLRIVYREASRGISSDPENWWALMDKLLASGADIETIQEVKGRRGWWAGDVWWGRGCCARNQAQDWRGVQCTPTHHTVHPHTAQSTHHTVMC